MASRGYKKYMKKNFKSDHPLFKIFVIAFFGSLLFSTFLINSLAKKMTVDTSVGEYKEQQYEDMEDKKIVDNRLEMIQSEDQGRTFSQLMQQPQDTHKQTEEEVLVTEEVVPENKPAQTVLEEVKLILPEKKEAETTYKVFVGTYTSAEQAKVAMEIIQESVNNLNPIVKYIGVNNYTLQVGSFKNKNSAEALLNTIQKSNLPGRIVQQN